MTEAVRLLAVDIGTQSLRALVFDGRGALLARSQVALPAPAVPQPGAAELDAEIYWQALCECCRAVTAALAAPVDALALTTLRDTVLCCEESGTPLRPAILWLDRRQASRLPPLPRGLRPALGLVGIGDLIDHFRREAESNWLAEHEPGQWARCDRFVYLSGWLHHRLTGRWCDADAAQVGFLPFDYRRRRWAAARSWRWRMVAARPAQMCELHPPGTPLGVLQAGPAALLGLPAGLPVIAAGADKACETLGCGLAPDAGAALSLGTTATVNATLSRYRELRPPLPAYPAARAAAWDMEVQIHRGFWLVSWFQREFGQIEAQAAQQNGVPVGERLDALLRSVAPGADGLLLQPYWSPGIRDPGPEARGAVIGFRDGHGRAHLYRALIEGLAYALRDGVERIERRLGRPLDRLVAAGGGSSSDAVVQVLADVIGRPIERPEHSEAAALGAAINAAVGIGCHADHAAAVAAMCRPRDRCLPDPAHAADYARRYRTLYRPLYRRLRPLYRRLLRTVDPA